MITSRILVQALVLSVLVSGAEAQEHVAVKPSAPRVDLGPPPIPMESDVLRYVFEHFPDKNREEVMAFIGENFKADLPVFRKMVDEEPSLATSYMLDLVSDALQLMEIARKDKDLAGMMVRQKNLERKAANKAREAALAEGAEKEAMKKELRKMLQEAFDAKQELMKRDLAGMEEQLRKLSEMISKRDQYRDQIIEKKVNEMTVEEDYLKW
jgi:hypothetical protein